MQFGKIITEEVIRNGQVSNRVRTEVISVLVANNAELMRELITMLENAEPKSTVDFRIQMNDLGKPGRIEKTMKVQGL